MALIMAAANSAIILALSSLSKRLQLPGKDPAEVGEAGGGG